MLVFGLSLILGSLGKGGVNTTLKVAGEKAVKAGQNKVSEAVIEGTVMGAEKTSDQFIKYK